MISKHTDHIKNQGSLCSQFIFSFQTLVAHFILVWLTLIWFKLAFLTIMLLSINHTKALGPLIQYIIEAPLSVVPCLKHFGKSLQALQCLSHT